MIFVWALPGVGAPEEAGGEARRGGAGVREWGGGGGGGGGEGSRVEAVGRSWGWKLRPVRSRPPARPPARQRTPGEIPSRASHRAAAGPRAQGLLSQSPYRWRGRAVAAGSSEADVVCRDEIGPRAGRRVALAGGRSGSVPLTLATVVGRHLAAAFISSVPSGCHEGRDLAASPALDFQQAGGAGGIVPVAPACRRPTSGPEVVPAGLVGECGRCLLYTSPSPRD